MWEHGAWLPGKPRDENPQKTTSEHWGNLVWPSKCWRCFLCNFCRDVSGVSRTPGTAEAVAAHFVRACSLHIGGHAGAASISGHPVPADRGDGVAWRWRSVEVLHGMPRVQEKQLGSPRARRSTEPQRSSREWEAVEVPQLPTRQRTENPGFLLQQLACLGISP